MRAETKMIYYADDGTVFDDESACKKYEDEIKEKEKHTSYWVVRHSPDTTEGRGHFGITYIEAYIPTNYPPAQAWVEDWCIKTFGRKLDFVQGVAPVEAWILQSIDRQRFLAKQGTSLGSYKVDGGSISLIVGGRDLGLLKVEK